MNEFNRLMVGLDSKLKEFMKNFRDGQDKVAQPEKLARSQVIYSRRRHMRNKAS